MCRIQGQGWKQGTCLETEGDGGLDSEVGPEVVEDSTCVSKERQYPLNQDLKSSEYLLQTAKMATNSFPPCIHKAAVQF